MAGQQWSQDITSFKNQFDGGTRPNRFIVTGEIGKGEGVEKKEIKNILVKAASIPAQTLGIIQVPFRGRVAKLPGDRVYAEWTFTLLDTNEEGKDSTRRHFELWHESFNKHFANTAHDGSVLDGIHPESYTEWTVGQLNTQGTEIQSRSVRLYNCWPVEVGAIDLSYDTADALTEYSITLAYDYLALVDGTDATPASFPMKHAVGGDQT